MTPRVLLYVQHLLGIGHLRRAAAIARALAGGGFDVAFVSGGEGVPSLDIGAASWFSCPPSVPAIPDSAVWSMTAVRR